MVYFLIVIGVILLDHLVKYAVASQMVPGESIPVISEPRRGIQYDARAVGIFDPAPVRSDPDSADHFVLEA